MANGTAAQLLVPISPGGDLSNAYRALQAFAPDLQARVGAFTAAHGPILRNQRLDATARGLPAILSLSVHRVRPGLHMAVVEDVTQLVEQERLIAGQKQRLAAIVDHVRDYAIFTLDVAGRIDEWNPSIRRHGGWEARDVVGRGLEMFQADADEMRAAEAQADLVRQAAQVGSAEAEGWRVRRDGSRLWGNTVVTALPDPDGALRGFAVVERDLTDRKELEDQLRRLALTDPLTGAANRRAGHDALLAALAEPLPVSVLMLDIDHFKGLNDRFGHDAGDAVLRAVVTAGRQAVEEAGTLARWGGEEFMVVLPGADAERALDVAQRVLQAVRSLHVDVGANVLSATVSIGVATTGERIADRLLCQADAALYRAKRTGRDKIEISAQPGPTHAPG
jgi:diguanylate cyclase (GGDEF)-like protein/PAS domain S-box-containing protein